MYEGLIIFDGVQLANNERYAALAAAVGLPQPRKRCAGLRAVLADDPYTQANAPWADPGTPEAAGFGGLYVSSVTGLDTSTLARELSDTVGDNPAIPGPARSTARTMLVTAFTAATSPAALGYGLAWLRAQLYDACADACGGATLCMLAECPTCDASTGALADGCWEDQVRTLHDVVAVSGPNVVSRHAVAGCSPNAVSAIIEFTLVAASPHIYRAPALVGADLAFTDPPDTGGCDVTWVETGPGRGTCPPHEDCPTPPSRLTDPAARPLAVLPPAPQHGGACVTRLRSAWTLATADPGLTPRHLDTVPVVTVTTGGADMRRLTLRFHPNPTLTDIDTPAQLDPCTALAEINVGYLPRDAELVLDGRSRTAYVRLPGGHSEDADGVLYGPGGGPWTWPVLACGSALTVAALVDAEHHSPDARLRVELAARQDLA